MTDKQKMEHAGLKIISSESIKFNWIFKTAANTTVFCRKLFGMDKVIDADLFQIIKTYLGSQTK